MTVHYIALEGIEGAGKSSLAPIVAERLTESGRTAISVREPGGTTAGEGIRTILLHANSPLEPWTEALLFAAQRAQLAAEVIGPALAAGTSVVGDRSVYSSLAYQGAGRGLGIDLVRSVNKAGLGDVWPDRVVLLQIDAGTGLGRQTVTDRIGGEGLALQERAAEAYGRFAADDPDRFVVVEASKPLGEVAADVVERLLESW